MTCSSVKETETALYYLQSRYYDPVLGRFLNADAFVSTGQGILGNNMFAYCNDNPISYADDTGFSLKPNTVYINDSTGGVPRSGTTNSEDLNKINEWNKQPVEYRVVDYLLESESIEIGMEIIKIGSSSKKIVNNFALLLAPDPTLYTDLKAIASITYNVVKVVGSITKLIIYAWEEL